MHYSEFPHNHYIVNGKGPGQSYLGDHEKWNWRWLFIGETYNPAFDQALNVFFNEHQRMLMLATPLEALDGLRTAMPGRVGADLEERAIEAQLRMYPPPVSFRDGNVIVGNFGRRT